MDPQNSWLLAIQTLIYLLLWRDFADIMEVSDQLTLRLAEYPGGTDLITWALGAEQGRERCAPAGLEEGRPLYCELSGIGEGYVGGAWKGLAGAGS